MEERYLMASDAGQLLKRSAASVRGYARAGRLPSIRTLNGTRLFKQRDVEQLAEELAGKSARVSVVAKCLAEPEPVIAN